MVLRPITTDSACDDYGQRPAPAWPVVAERQKRRADQYWLISQPDHARFSGELAAQFRSALFPRISSELAKAIGTHDAGWEIFPAEADPSHPPRMSSDGRPLAFIEFPAEEFLRAWNCSIERATEVCARGGIIVSRHFCELGGFRLRHPDGLHPGEADLITAFLQNETRRQQRLLVPAAAEPDELDGLLEVLQFCDLLSLYLCSGAQRPAAFPQRFGDRPVTICREPFPGNGADQWVYRLDPSPFQDGGGLRVVSLGVRARYFCGNVYRRTETLKFLIC